ncbi:MAG: N-acetylglucosamine-6-phosphate deacetylase [Acidimicrobiia bacterium]
MGELVAPGLIDLQVNGAYGHDFTSDPTSIWEVGRRLPEQGVTGFLPTIITSPPEVMERAIEAIQSRPANYLGAEPLGLHFEGPMLSPNRPGVHDPALMRPPSPDLIETWTAANGVLMLTLAPELPGAEAVVKTLTQAGVIVSAGHTAATYEEAQAGFDWGITAVTHLFNAMAPFGHRAPGLIGATFDSAVAGLICDGVHVHPAAVRTAWRMLGPDRLVLVTDAVAAAGMGDGTYRLGNAEIVVSQGRATDQAGRLAGSTLTLDQAVRNLIEFTDCPPMVAIGAASTVPARLLGGLENPGRVVFDDSMEVASTSVRGEIVWRR